MSIHSHAYSGSTSYNDGHIHYYGEVTSKEKDTPNHIHYIEGYTTFNNGHLHRYSTKTGPAIPSPHGGHYHYYETRVEYADGHTHLMRGYTSSE